MEGRNPLVSSITILVFALVPNTEHRVYEEECQQSSLTARTVYFCPRTMEEWKKAVLRKNCSQFRHNCSSFQYHCVINAWANETIEVCASATNIVGKACAEFSYGGNRVQRHYSAECKKCPVVYQSVDSYKYQECYMLMNESKEQAAEFINSVNTTVLPDQDVSPNKTAYEKIILRPAQEPFQNEKRGSGGFINMVRPLNITFTETLSVLLILLSINVMIF